MKGDNIILDLSQDAEITWLSLLAPSTEIIVGADGEN